MVAVVVGCLLSMACGGNDKQPANLTATPRAIATPTKVPEGVQAQVDPRHGAPGSEITISGSGWPANVQLEISGYKSRPDPTAKAYETTMTNASGSFSVSFRLEKKPDGSDLEVGGFTLVVQGGNERAEIPFLVESPRPIFGPGPGS